MKSIIEKFINFFKLTDTQKSIISQVESAINIGDFEIIHNIIYESGHSYYKIIISLKENKILIDKPLLSNDMEIYIIKNDNSQQLFMEGLSRKLIKIIETLLLEKNNFIKNLNIDSELSNYEMKTLIYKWQLNENQIESFLSIKDSASRAKFLRDAREKNKLKIKMRKIFE